MNVLPLPERHWESPDVAASQASARVFWRAAAVWTPALVMIADALWTLRHQPALVASASTTLFLAGVWCALWLLPGWRRAWLELAATAVERAPYALLLIFAALCLLFGASNRLWWALAAALFCLAVEAARAAWRRNPARCAATAAMLAINLVLLTALDLALHRWVLPHRSHNRVYIDHDPYLGWKLRPNLAITRQGRFGAHETTNALGFRGPLRPFAKPAETRRVVVLGDSHAEGYTVNDNETFYVHLERELNRRMSAEVISLGVAGFSTDQEYLSYLVYGRRFEPDVVLLVFCDNDVKYNMADRYWRGYKPRFVRHGSALVLEGVPVPDARASGLFPRGLVQTSALAWIIEDAVAQLAAPRAQPPSEDEEAWRVTDLLLAALCEAVKADNARLVVINATPDVRDYATDRKLRELLAARGIDYIDIDPLFHGCWDEVRLPGDHHWTAAGHRRIGEFLAAPLAELMAVGAAAVR